MLVLENSELSVELLDPQNDRALLSPRFCSGGYVRQVYDRTGAPLLARPQPTGEPFNPDHGQGMPEGFSRSPGSDSVPHGEPLLVLGVGELTSHRESRARAGTVHTVAFSHWPIHRREAAIEMRTRHEYQDRVIEIERIVELHGRRLSSTTVLRNLSHLPLAFQWFARPIFPLSRSGEICSFIDEPIFLDNHPHFTRTGSRTVAAQAPPEIADGAYARVGLPESCERLEAHLPHDAIGEVAMRTDFRPYHLPVWVNAVACSLQPYYQHVVIAGLEERWSLEYTFGPRDPRAS